MSSTMQGAIVCQSRYGATRQYADWLGGKLDLRVYDLKTDLVPFWEYDYLILGSSAYLGKLLIKRWLAKHQADLTEKKLFFFIVCATPATDKKARQKILRNSIPPALADVNKVFFLPGKLIIHRLSWRDRLILRLGARLEKDPEKRAGMQHDIDGLDIGQLAPLVDAVSAALPTAYGHA